MKTMEMKYTSSLLVGEIGCIILLSSLHFLYKWIIHTHTCGHELGKTLGDGEGQGGLACCSPWDCKESDTTWRLKNNKKYAHITYIMWYKYYIYICHIYNQKAILKIFSSAQFSRVWLFAIPWTTGWQASLSNSWSLLKLMSIELVMPSNHLLSPSPPVFNLSQHQGLFKRVSSSHEVAKVLEFQLQHQSFQWTPRTDLLQDGLVGSPCSPRDSQESSPTPQFKSINSSVLSFLYSPSLTSIYDY